MSECNTYNHTRGIDGIFHMVINHSILILSLLRDVKTIVLLFLFRQVRERLKKDVEQMKLQDPNFRPGLVVLQVNVMQQSA